MAERTDTRSVGSRYPGLLDPLLTPLLPFIGSDSGFLDESGTMAAWHLEGKLSSDATFVDSEAAEYQRQQQDSLRQERQGTTASTTPPSGGGGVADMFTGRGVSSSTGAGDGGGGGGDAIGKFLQRVADASGTPSSMLGGLPEDDPPAFLEAPRRGGGGAAAGVGAGGEGADQEQPQHAPHLVLFARVKGRPFVYCGAVDCVAQEYVWSAGSSLGMVRFTLALREWHEAATAVVPAEASSQEEEAPRNSDGRGAATAPSAGGGRRSSVVGEVGAGAYGEGNSFAGLVEEGFRR